MTMGKLTQTLKSKFQPENARYKASSLIKAAAITCLIALSGGMLSACSFKPLYGTTQTNQKLQDVLSTIQVAEVPGRVGQAVRNELIFRFTGGGNPGIPQYKLVMIVRESVTSQLVRRDGDIQGQFYELTTNFQLFSHSNPKEPILKGVSIAKAAFRDNESVYANVRSRVDAENRAAKTAAEDLQGRISAFLSGNS